MLLTHFTELIIQTNRSTQRRTIDIPVVTRHHMCLTEHSVKRAQVDLCVKCERALLSTFHYSTETLYTNITSDRFWFPNQPTIR